MTRVVVQRGPSANQTQQSRAPPSNSASAPPSSTSNSQPNDLSDDVSESEAADVSKGEPHTCLLNAGGSGKGAVLNEVESLTSQNEENLARQLQNVLIQELHTTPEFCPSGSESSTVSLDGQGQSKPLEELPGSSESNSRPSGRAVLLSKGPSYIVTSHNSMPSAAPVISNPSSSSSSSVSPPSVAVNDTVPVSRTTSHEENDVGRAASMASDPVVVCSPAIPLAPPPPPCTPVPSRRNGWVGCSALNANRGPSSRRKSITLKGTRSSPNSSRPTSPRSYGEGDGYNSADEQSPWTPGPSGYKDGAERERQFEMELRRVKGLEVRHMAEDGNCLFRAVTDRVYGDPEMYDETRQMCIDYMEKERDHFSQFVTESFTAYCKRKRRDKVYGNNLEIQAMAEIYNRPIHIYSYSTEPINILHGSYETDLPPIRLSYHRGNHYNSIVDPCNPAVGVGLGFGSLRGRNIEPEQVKAALNAQQEQQIDKVLLAEGRYYSDMELTEQEIERMVMEASRAEYLAGESRRAHNSWQEETSTSAGAEPSSSRTTGSPRSTSDVMDSLQPSNRRSVPLSSTQSEDSVISENVRMLLFMGFSYLRVMEAHSIFGDNINNMLCYLLETEAHGPGTGENIRRKGKAAE